MQRLAAAADPQGPDDLTAVPTILRSGDAFNVVPGSGELIGDLRASNAAVFDRLVADVPADVDGVRLEAELLRRWPGMDAREAAAPVLRRAGELAGMALDGGSRGGASDASHFASAIAVTIDGLGPRGGGAHAPHEFVQSASLRPRAAVALAVAAAALGA